MAHGGDAGACTGSALCCERKTHGLRKDRARSFSFAFWTGNSCFCPGKRSVKSAALIRDGAVQITVEDNGIGISAENLPHIFERFFRADTARDRTGTGLWLSIVQWIVQLHDGTIRAESRQGVGTRFTVTLPVRQGEK